VFPETTNDWWIDIGPTNKYAMFDYARNTQTTIASPLTVVLTPGERCNSVAVLGLVADHIQISATSVLGGGSVYNSGSIDLTIRRVLDHYDYAFEPFATRPSYVVMDIPPYSDIVITVAITHATLTPKCGSCVLGNFRYLGSTEYSAESGAQNFSTVTRDIYGNATLVPRRTLPKTKQTVAVPSERIDRCKDIRTDLNAVPAVWLGVDDSDTDFFESMVILGIYKEFSFNHVEPTLSKLTLELEEI
jgi:hypothetical protein